ncbi:uncharacterized protein LOC142983408 [Anticarsia gemmatalis]|uniref:uncharacterized protein LOC142983408 n=1 Tax=Anticarsia gemmatalis TaxID=129554 RepID=UPI003F77313B
MIAVALVCIACAAYWVWRQYNTRSDEPPSLPGAWPILGHAPSLAMGDSLELWDIINDLADQSYDMGGVMSAQIGPRTVYIVTDPDDMLTISNACLEKDGFYDFAKPWLGEGLVTGKMSIWKNHRKLLNPAFSQTVLDTFMGVFNSQSRKLVKDLEKEAGKGPFDHWIYTRHNALETICLTALGVDFTDCNLNSDYVEATDKMFGTLVERFMKFWWHSPHTFRYSLLKKRQDGYLKILHNMSITALNRRKSEFDGNVCAERSIIPGTKFKAFMDLLLELSIEKGVLNDREIREHVDTMIVGGHDTSANVLMYAMLLLGSHPEVQEKAVAELKEVLGDGDRDVEKQDLSQLVFLEAVIKESMRIHTIVPVLARKLDRDVKLKNCTLSSGRTCFMFVFGLHKHPIWGSDRLDFKPERWLDPDTLPESPNAYAAFGVGRRMCIGKIYALMSMKTTLAHLIRNYRISADYSQLQLKMDVMLKPVTGYYVSIDKRTVYIVPRNPLVPVIPGKLPVLGHALQCCNSKNLYNFLRYIGKFTCEKGGVASLYFGPVPFYVVTDAEDITMVLNKSLDKMFVYKLIEPVLGKMLVAAEVPAWKRNRRIIDLGFKQKILDDYLDLFNREAARLTQVLAEDVGRGEVDVTDKATRSVLETTCRTTMGERFDGKDLVNDNYVKAVDTLLQIISLRLFKPWYMIEYIFNMSRYKKMSDESSKIFSSLSKQMVKLRNEEHMQRLKNKEVLKSNGSRFQGLLDILIENSVTDTGSTFTDEELTNLVDNVLLAAFDTTVMELVMILVCLGSRREVQEKIYQEIQDVLGVDGEVTKENISKLVYLEAAIKETIRLYPIGPVIARQATNDVELRNVTIPAGSNIIVHLWAANTDPEYWGPDAKEYKPERWFNDSLPEHPAAYASFSPGRRGCPGKAYALMYLKTTLAPLIRKYKFTADVTRVKFDVNVMMKPTSGHEIQIEFRE